MKQRIRLTENDLHRIVKESVKRIIREWEENPEEKHKGDALDTCLREIHSRKLLYVAGYFTDGKTSRDFENAHNEWFHLEDVQILHQGLNRHFDTADIWKGDYYDIRCHNAHGANESSYRCWDTSANPENRSW